MKSLKNGLLLLLAMLLSSCGPSKQTLNLFLYGDSIAPKVISDFEAQFHCKVILDVFNSGDAVMTKLASGGKSRYDVVCIGESEVPTFQALGLLAPLRSENLPNLRNLDPDLTRISSDPEYRFSTPYSWIIWGLLVRKPQSQPLDESWSLIFDPARQRGSFLLVDESRSCIAAALCYKGYSINSINSTELAEVRDLLIAAKKRSLGFAAPIGLENRVLSKQADIVMTISGLDPNVPRDPDVYFFVPREGSFAGIDSLAIPAQSPHRDLAEKFLNFVLDADVAAQNTTFLGSATPNKAARNLLPPAIRNNPQIYPTSNVLRRLQGPKALGDNAKLYDEIWTQIKSK